ncbi:MAG: phosphoribosyltransferase [Sulfuricurvum sp.]|uniref:phosphoribosyltransferase n=1 Tax=Sulfuricurvum sp. TaxID=2025608 RepID=UPI0025F30C76|nr:phosphoribosyltransferase family protein [Sulfuricurvum sp.]MCK9373377.1 phosphoribosyltransferase [Sulfuricurvum sp.]
MILYTYNHFKTDILTLGHQCEPFEPDTVVAIARGGMTLAHALSMYMNIRNLQSIRIESYDEDRQRDTVTIFGECDFSRSRRVLIVDDIVDSGKTLQALLPILSQNYPDILFKSAALFTKTTALIQPDYSLHEATDWIDFFWERDFLKSNLL